MNKSPLPDLLMPAFFQQGSLYILLASLLVGTLWRGAYSSDPDNLLPAWVFITLLLSTGAWELVVTIVLRQKRTLASPAWLMFMAFTIFCMAGLAWSISTSDTIRETLLVLGYAMVIFTLRGQLLRSGWKVMNLATSWFAFVAAFVSAWSIVAYVFHIYPYMEVKDNLARVGGTFEYSNALSCFCLMALPLVFALMEREKPGDRPLNVLGGTMIIATVLITFSRLGLVLLAAMFIFFIVIYRQRAMVLPVVVSYGLGLAAALLAMIALEAHYYAIGMVAVILVVAISYPLQLMIESVRYKRLITRVTIATVVCGLLAALLLLSFNDEVQNKITSRFGSDMTFESLLGHRLDVYRGVYDGFQDRPVAGSGLGTFAAVLYRDYVHTSPTKFAHNVVLQMAVDTGIVGVTLFTIFLIYSVVLIIRHLFGRSDILLRSMAVASVVFLLYSMFDWEWYIPALTAWFMVIVALMEGGAGARDSCSRGAGRARPGYHRTRSAVRKAR